MAWSVPVVVLLVCALLSFLLSGGILLKLRTRETVAFALLVFGCGIYSCGYAGELSARTLEGKLLWSYFQYLGIAVLPPLWMTYVIHYTGRQRMLAGPLRWLLWVIPAAVMVAHPLDRWLGLVYREAKVVDCIFGTTLEFVPGPLYYINIGFIYATGIVGMVTLWTCGRAMARLHRQQCVMLILVAIIQLIGNFAFISGHSPWGKFDTGVLGNFVAVVVLYVAIVRKELVLLAPVPREFIVEKLPQGVLVFDAATRLCEANESARALLALTADCQNRSAAEILPAAFVEAISSGTAPRLCEGVVNGRTLSATVTFLRDSSGHHIGWTVMLVDIGERRRTEARLAALLKSEAASRGSSTEGGGADSNGPVRPA
jgi:PAS domain-containing protein